MSKHIKNSNNFGKQGLTVNVEELGFEHALKKLRKNLSKEIEKDLEFKDFYRSKGQIKKLKNKK